MENTQDCKVVMLPTEGFKYGYSTLEGDLVITNGNLEVYERPSSFPEFKQVKQHLYFTSNEEIKEGDYVWWNNGIHKTSSITKMYLHTTSFKEAFFGRQKEYIGILLKPKLFFKVVASTDSSSGLPIIPESFLKQYVAANGKITNVKLKLDVQTIAGIGVPRKHNLELTANNEVVVAHWTEDGKIWDEIRLGSPQSCVLGTTKEDKELEEAFKKQFPPMWQGLHNDYRLEGFKAGWKANPKQFTEEDMKNAFDAGWSSKDSTNLTFDSTIKEWLEAYKVP